ncbi:type IV toxin-antitoxin system AbiEi family antitoxin domain-containing protein [Catellatospora paridis]|uniref:type IV toxin-antitoxin system AbiEi family antitoxin domain-containing protein n=1 Tax=Catellatospora paridis TaxID=1617086 RepID=UPI0012D4373C|nr:type IV toxin-antitoxin system AbiEi family antitoxin domain-containing protein [Catellatospora paridis]
MTSDPAAVLDELAHRQQQLLTRAQVLAAGHTDMMIYRRIQTGRWQRVLAGVYCVHGGTLTDEQRRVAAALYAGPDAQITGPSALTWYGFRALPPAPEVNLLVPHATRCRSNGFAVVKRALTLDHRARHTDLYRVVSPARAVIDTCRELRELRTVRAVMAEAVQRFRVPPKRLDDEIRRAARSRTAVARKVLAEIAGGARSAPQAQEDWARSLERHNVLGRHGVQVLHFTPSFVAGQPDEVRRIVAEAATLRRGFRTSVRVVRSQ